MPPQLMLLPDSDSDYDYEYHGHRRLGTYEFQPWGNDVGSPEGTALKLEDVELHLGVLGGNCGAVHRGTIKSTGDLVALRSFKVEDRERRRRLLTELRILAQSVEVCPNIVRCCGGISARQGVVYMVTECLELGSLADLQIRMQRKGEQAVSPGILACITRQIMFGLEYLHSKGVLHRRIEPSHILHNFSGEVKLSEVRQFAHVEPECLYAACAQMSNATYLSPEQCLGEDTSYGTDIWSTGLVMYELACGHYPFNTSSFPALFVDVCEKPEPRLDESQFPAELCEFVASCLTRDVAQRSHTAILREHAFLALESVELLTAFIELSSADSTVCVTCYDLGGNQKFHTVIEGDSRMSTLESYLIESFPGYRSCFNESGASLSSQEIVKDHSPSLTFSVANSTALARYVAGLMVQ